MKLTPLIVKKEAAINHLHNSRKFYRKDFLVALLVLILLTACNGSVGNAQPVSTSTPVPDLELTAQAYSTSIAANASVVQTSQALATQRAQVPRLVETATPIIITPGPTLEEPTQPAPTEESLPVNMPVDIPLLSGERVDLFVAQNLVSYQSAALYQDVVAFYEQAMAGAGWIKQESGSYITATSAYLIYIKPARRASLTIQFNPISKLTGIVITIQG